MHKRDLDRHPLPDTTTADRFATAGDQGDMELPEKGTLALY